MAVSNGAKDSALAVEQKLGTAELLFQRAEAMNMTPSWVTPGGTFAVQVNGREEYVNSARSTLNSHRSVSLAKNKYVTRRILERHKIANIPFLLPKTPEQAVAFLREHETIIAKPINGSGSRDIHIITSEGQLTDLYDMKYILEKYITGKELRYLVLNGAVIGVHQSNYGTSVAHDRALERISFPKNQWDKELVSTALQAAHILGLQFAAVDFLIDDTGTSYILEINSTPGLKWFHAPTSGPIVDVASQFLEAVLYTPAQDRDALRHTTTVCPHCLARLDAKRQVA